MTNLTPASLIPLTIDKMIPGGFGLGRLADGLVVMVRHTLPGEQLLVRSLHLKKTFMEAELAEVLKPSPDRAAPFCSHYDRCGSCDFQHIHMDAQLRIKKMMLLENLAKNSDLQEHEAVRITTDPIPSPSSQGYRQRIRLQVVDGITGFYQVGSHTIEPLTSCPLACDAVNRVAEEFCNTAIRARLLNQTESIEFLLNPDTGKVVCLLHVRSKMRPAQLSKFEQIAAEIETIESILFTIMDYGTVDTSGKRVKTPPQLSCTLPVAIHEKQLQLSWEAGGFCQVNLNQNVNLIQKVLQFAAPGPADRILDLYCGMGNLTLPLATHCGSITGIEGQGSAIRSGKKNISINGIENCTFMKTPVAEGVRQLIATGKQFETIILDPPRQGAAEIIPLLPSFAAQKIIYVSCDPATLSRDLVGLRQNGYILKSIIPIDMFPQTHHLESIALLEKPVTPDIR